MLQKAILENIVIGLSIIMPIAIMSSQDIPSPLFYTLVFVGLIVLLKSKITTTDKFTYQHRYLLICMATPTIAVLFASVWYGKLAGLDLEGALRFFLGTWILGLLYSTISKDRLKFTLLGFLGATVFASIYIFYLLINTAGRPQTADIYNAVGYGSITALLMTISLFTIKINFTNHKKLELIMKIAIAAIAFMAVIFIQTRTAWVAMPLFILIAAVLFVPIKYKAQATHDSNKNILSKIIGLAIIILIAITSVFATNDTVRDRIALAYNEAVNCIDDKSTTDNSICIRFQLWRASADMLHERPWAGNGSKRYFNDYLQQESLPKGIVSQFVADGWGEPHNDLMLAFASFGYLGGITLLLIYFAPAIVFLRRLSFKNSPEIRAYAAIGLCFCLGFFIFGLTETMFRGMRTISFYAFGIALFASLSSNQIDQK